MLRKVQVVNPPIYEAKQCSDDDHYLGNGKCLKISPELWPHSEAFHSVKVEADRVFCQYREMKKSYLGLWIILFIILILIVMLQK
jgi:hypothetical protein